MPSNETAATATTATRTRKSRRATTTTTTKAIITLKMCNYLKENRKSSRIARRY